MASRKQDGSKHSPLRLVLWSAIIGLLIGLVNAGAMLEDLAEKDWDAVLATNLVGDALRDALDSRSS